MTLVFVLITQIIRVVNLRGVEKQNNEAPRDDRVISKQHSREMNKSIESFSVSTNVNKSVVYDHKNKKYIQSGAIVSLTCNGPAMFYLLDNNDIEVQPIDKTFKTNLENPTQIFIFRRSLYAIDNGQLHVALNVRSDAKELKFIKVPAFASLNDIKYISGREDRFALCRENNDPEFNQASGIYTYQFDGKKTVELERYEGKRYYFGYDPEIYAILDNDNTLTVYDKDKTRKFYNVKTMAFDADNEPIIINLSDTRTREIESYFGNVYLLKDR